VTKPEKLDRWILMSILLHAGLLVIVLFSPGFFSLQGSENWGGPAAGNAIAVKIDGNFGGIALPAPEVVTENAAASDSKGLYKSEPEPPPPPPDKAEPIPEKTAPKKAPKVEKAAAPAPPTDKVPKKPTPQPETPSNAIPSSGGGQPALSYGQANLSAGPATSIGDGGAFGTKYASYVQAMVRKISQNWLKGLVDPSVTQAPRVYVSFDIDRAGNITNIAIQQPSNIPTLDNSAKRALYASTPLLPLPPDYAGTKVSVSFYFEYKK